MEFDNFCCAVLAFCWPVDRIVEAIRKISTRCQTLKIRQVVIVDNSFSNVQLAEKNPYPPHGRSSVIPKGRGVLRAKILEGKYEAKMKGRRGGGGGGERVQNKKKIPRGE